MCLRTFSGLIPSDIGKKYNTINGAIRKHTMDKIRVVTGYW